MKKPKRFDRILWCVWSEETGEYPFLRDSKKWADYLNQEQFSGKARVFKVRVKER